MSYITKTEQKKYMGVDFTSAMDTFIDTLISAAERYVEKYCGDDKLGVRLFEAPSPDDDSVRKFDGNGQKRLYVGDLFSLTSLTVDDVLYVINEDFFLYPLNNTDKSFDYIELAQPATRLNSNSRLATEQGYNFEVAQANVVVDGKWYHTSTAPDDIKVAIMKIVAGVIKENVADKDVKEAKSEKLGDYSVAFQEVSKVAHALEITDLLDQYKRKAPTGSVGVTQVS